MTLNSKTFLIYAVEINGDGIGNDDGLCETSEDCIYTPNVGAYQGEGTISSGYCSTTSSAAANIVSNAKIFKYVATNVP